VIVIDPLSPGVRRRSKTSRSRAGKRLRLEWVARRQLSGHDHHTYVQKVGAEGYFPQYAEAAACVKSLSTGIRSEDVQPKHVAASCGHISDEFE